MSKQLPMLLLLCVAIVGLLCPTMTMAQEEPPAPERLHIPYWHADGVTDPTLHLAQNRFNGFGDAPYPIPVKVTLRPYGNGTPIIFDATVPVAGVLAVPLKPYLPPGSTIWGAAEVALPTGSDPYDILSVDAEVLTKSTRPGGILMVSETSRLGIGGIQSALVQRPTSTTRIYLVMKDSSGRNAQSYSLSWNGAPSFAQSQPLPSYSAVMLDLTSHVPVGSVKSLEVTTSVGWPALGTVLIVDEASNMATAIPMEESPLNSGDIEVFSPPFSWGGTWTAKAGVINLGNSSVIVIPYFYWFDGGGVLRQTKGYSKSLAAHTGSLFTLAELGAPVGPTQLAVKFSGVGTNPRITGTIFHGNLVAPRIQMPLPMIGQESGVLQKAAVGIGLGIGSDDTTAILGATNMDAEPSTMTLQVSYVVGGVPTHYTLSLGEVPPGGFRLVNIRELRDNQVPGAGGHVLPADLTSGSAHLWGDGYGTMVGQDATYSLQGQWVVQCAQACIGSDDPEDMRPRCMDFRFAGGRGGGGLAGLRWHSVLQPVGCQRVSPLL